MVAVEIRAPDLTLIPHWEALAKRTSANVFMHPAALCAAAAAGFAKVHVLLAWNGERLVGLWALREWRLRFLPAFLAAPPYEYAFLASPVIDPEHADAVMAAFLDAIAKARALPNVIELKLLDGDDVSLRALMNALGGRPLLKLSERERPFLNNAGERKRSGSTAKKLRQDWNRLAALGVVAISNERAADAVRDAFEIFLTLESESWKGKSGTALLSRESDAAFARRWMAALAAHGSASVALLGVDDKPIAAQVLLYSGTMAYTWKTAFDAEFAKFSPGALLIDKASDALFASGTETIESCSPAGSFMEHLWTGRRATMDMLVDVSARKSLAFRLAAAGERIYALARDLRDRTRAVSWPLPKRKSLAVTRS